MAKTEIRPGAVIDHVTPVEMREHLSHVLAQHFHELARGIQPVRFDATDTIAGAAVTIPAAGESPIGPRNGFVWQLGAIRATGLATNDSLSIWRNSSKTNSNFLATLTAAAPVWQFQKHVYLLGGEKLIVTGTGLAATGDITVNGEGLSAAEVDLYKLI